jgi:formate-dependent nitrite reductase membrane component NrfD
MDEKPLTVTRLLPPKKQTEWRWPAAANFILGGAGTGFYVLGFFTMIFEHGTTLNTHPISFGLLGPVLVSIGLASLLTEVGRPLRGRYLLHHLQNAWISRETLAFVFFIITVSLDYVAPHLTFKFFAVLSAFAFMLCQGLIAYSARAVAAWNVPVMPFFFLTSGLASGAGVALLIFSSHRHLMIDSLLLLSFVSVSLNLIGWFIYLRGSVKFSSPPATVTLRCSLATHIIVLLGHLVPLLLLALLKISTYLGMASELFVILTSGSGLALIVGVIGQKAAIFLTSGYTREIVLRP